MLNYLQSLGGTPSVKVGDIPRPQQESNKVGTTAPPAAAAGARNNDPKAIVERYGCGACHVIGGQGGVIGPSLDRLGAAAAQRVPGQSAEAYLRQSILDPNAYVADGFPRGVMPQDLGDKMTAKEFEALVQYVLSLGR